VTDLHVGHERVEAPPDERPSVVESARRQQQEASLAVARHGGAAVVHVGLHRQHRLSLPEAARRLVHLEAPGALSLQRVRRRRVPAHSRSVRLEADVVLKDHGLQLAGIELGGEPGVQQRIRHAVRVALPPCDIEQKSRRPLQEVGRSASGCDGVGLSGGADCDATCGELGWR